MTGASGSIFARHLLDALDRDERVATVNVILSDSGLRVMAEELQVSGRNDLIQKLLGRESQKTHQQNNADIGANVASGSVSNRRHDRAALQRRNPGAALRTAWRSN